MDEFKKYEGFKGEKSIVFPRLFLESSCTDPLVNPIFPTDIGFYPHAQFHYRERSDGCEQNILIYCISGEGFLIIDDKKRVVKKDTLLVIPSGTPHIYGASETNPWSIFWLHFLGSNAKSYLRNTNLDNPTKLFSIDISSKIRLLFEDIFNVLEKGFNQEAMIFTCQAVANILGILFFQNQNYILGSKEANLQLEESIYFMNTHLQQTLSLKELAEQANLSSTHYSYLFKKRTGYSPIDYFLRLKIKRACQYLDMTLLKVNEISQIMGFNDPYYFSRAFFKIMQQSPTSYRNVKKG